jgi:hypothetical protein
MRSLVRCRSQHVDATAFLVELDRPINQGKERKILAAADVPTGVKHGADLADNNRPGSHCLAAKPLDSSARTLGVPTIAGRTLAFLMSHFGRSKSTGVGGSAERVPRAARKRPQKNLSPPLFGEALKPTDIATDSQEAYRSRARRRFATAGPKKFLFPVWNPHPAARRSEFLPRSPPRCPPAARS